MFSLSLTELHVLNEEHKEAYEQTGYFDDFFAFNDFLNHAKYYYQSSEFYYYYYYYG